MAVALVQKTAQQLFSGVTTTSRTITGVTSGNLVVCLVTAASSPNPGTPPALPTPSGWSVAENPTGPSPAITSYRPVNAVFYKANASAGSHTADFSGASALPTDSYGAITLFEVSGCDTSSPLDTHNTATAVSQLSPGSTPSVTNTVAAAIAFVIGHPDSGGVSSLSAPSGYTDADRSTNNSADASYDFAYKILSATGSQSATWTWTGGSDVSFQGTIVIFKAAAGGTAYDLTVDPASYSLTAAAETVTATRALTISPASYAVTAASVNLAVGRALNVSPASYALTTAAETMTAARSLNISPASYALTAADVTLTYAPSLKELVVDQASYAVSAADVSFAVTRALSIDPASYSLTNSAGTLSVGRVLSVSPASYALSASAQTLAVGRVLSVDPAAYALTLADVTLDYRPSNPVLSVDPVSYVLSLADVELHYGRAGGGGYDSKAKVRKRVNELNKKILQAEVEAQEITQVAVTKAKSVKKSADQGYDEDEDEALMLLL